MEVRYVNPQIQGPGNSGSAPAFQYIVTTTESPPETLSQKPWLLDPILDASSEGGRLLGVDI